VVGDAPSALGYSWALGPGLGDLVISGGTGFGFGSSRASLATARELCYASMGKFHEIIVAVAGCSSTQEC
jgi:hypothetical protein